MEPLRLQQDSPGVARNLKGVVQEAFVYLIVWGCAFVVDIAILYVLVHYCMWWYLAAATTSFIAGLLVAYLLSVKLVLFVPRRTA